jgi:integrase/recombinase XerD
LAVSWQSLQAAFLRHRQSQGLAPVTLALQSRWLADFEAFCRAERIRRPEEFTPEQLRRFHQALLWRPGRRGRLLAPNSLDMALRMVRAFLRWAHREGFLLQDSTRELRLSRPPQPTRRLLTAAELEGVRGLLDPSTEIGLRQAVLFELLQQLPLPELLSRDVAHLDLAGARLVLSDGLPLELEHLAVGSLAAYLERARPGLVRDSAQRALLLCRGGGRLGLISAQVCLRQLGFRAGLEATLGPRRLLQTARARADAFARGRLPLDDLAGGL